MDNPRPPHDDLEPHALRLERLAEDVDQLAARTRRGTSPSWQGAAADRHRDLVTGHAADFAALAADLREAACAVRVLGSTARERMALVEDVADLAWTPRPSLLQP